MNFSKFNHAYKRDGVIGFINVLFGKIGIKYRFKTLIYKRIKYLEEQLKKISKNFVLTGPYKNLKIVNYVNWSDYDFNSKILGIYEKEVQQKLVEWNCKNFINLGAAEGYHGLGQLITKTKSMLYVFEQDEISRKILKDNAQLNNLKDKVEIFGKADKNFLELLKSKNIDLRETCFLLDIEGDEYNILNDAVIKDLENSKLIIELHSNQSHQEKLLENLKKYFKIEILTTSKRDLSSFSFLENFSDIDRWLLVSENRPSMMRWVVCNPKL